MTGPASPGARALPRAGLPTDLVGTGAAALVAPLLAAFVAWPIARLAAALAPPDAAVLDALVRSVRVAGASTLVTLALALALAFAVTRAGIPGRRLVSAACLLPTFGPPFLAALALDLLLGPARGPGVLVAAQVLTFLPYAYLLLATALDGLDVSLDEAAESLGARRLTVLRRVTLVLLRPRLATTALVVFALALGDFANPFLLAGGHPVLTTLMYARAVGAHDAVAAATPAVLLLVPGVLAALVLARRDPGALPLVALLARRAPLRPAPALVRWPLAALAVLAALVQSAVPVLVVAGSLGAVPGGDWSPSFRHWAGLAAPGVASAVLTSVGLGGAAGLAGVLLAFAVAHAIRRARPPLARVLWWLALAPAALPGAVVGVAYLLALGAPAGPLAGTFWILVAGVVCWRLPVALRAAAEALGRVGPALEEAAVSLGAGLGRTYARVFVPLLAAPAWSLFFFFFVEGVVTVSVVVFLAAPGATPGAVTLLERAARGELGGACALAAVLFALVLAAAASARALAGPGRLAVPKL